MSSNHGRSRRVSGLRICPLQSSPLGAGGVEQWQALANDDLDPLLRAAVQATEESITNALCAAQTLTGIDGTTVYALPHDRLRDLLIKYHRSTRP